MQNTILRNISLKAVVLAWLAGATVFLAANLILMPLALDINAGVILRYTASLVMGRDVLVEDSSAPLIIGALVHYALSLAFTLIIVVVIFRWGLLIGIVAGAILGLAIYGINLYFMTLIFDWFFAANNSVLLLSHILFGATVGGVYEMFDAYDTDFIKENVA